MTIWGRDYTILQAVWAPVSESPTFMGQYLVAFVYIQGHIWLGFHIDPVLFLLDRDWWSQCGNEGKKVGILQEQSCSLIITADGLKSFCGRKLVGVVLGLGNCIGQKEGWNSGGGGFHLQVRPLQLGGGGCLLRRSFHMSCQLSQISCPVLWSSSENWRPLTF